MVPYLIMVHEKAIQCKHPMQVLFNVLCYLAHELLLVHLVVLPPYTLLP
jgi:hypothetical protein